MTTAAILAALHQMDEAPWGDIRGKPLDDRGLARRLKNTTSTRRSSVSGKAQHADMTVPICTMHGTAIWVRLSHVRNRRNGVTATLERQRTSQTHHTRLRPRRQTERPAV